MKAPGLAAVVAAVLLLAAAVWWMASLWQLGRG